MDMRTEERIRTRAFALSQQADRAHLSAVDHWLDAERMILIGLAEDAADDYEAPAATDVPRAGATTATRTATAA